MYKLFTGIDVSSIDLKVCVMNQDGDVLKSFTVDNNLPGAEFLRDQIVDLADKHSQEIQIGMESTSVYSWHPAMFLNEDRSSVNARLRSTPSMLS